METTMSQSCYCLWKEEAKTPNLTLSVLYSCPPQGGGKVLFYFDSSTEAVRAWLASICFFEPCSFRFWMVMGVKGGSVFQGVFWSHLLLCHFSSHKSENKPTNDMFSKRGLTSNLQQDVGDFVIAPHSQSHNFLPAHFHFKTNCELFDFQKPFAWHGRTFALF